MGGWRAGRWNNIVHQKEGSSGPANGGRGIRFSDSRCSCPSLNPLVLQRGVIQQGPRHNTLITDKLQLFAVCSVSTSSAPPADGRIIPQSCPNNGHLRGSEKSTSSYNVLDHQMEKNTGADYRLTRLPLTRAQDECISSIRRSVLADAAVLSRPVRVSLVVFKERGN